MRYVDLSHPFNMHSPGWIDYPNPKISYFQRHASDGIVSQYLESPLHISTHLDAEMHGISGGGDIASIPLDRLIHEGVVVDLRDEVDDFSLIEPEMVTEQMEVKKGDILLLNTGWHHYYNGREEEDEIRYFCKHPGASPRFAEWMVDMELRWLGVDCGSADHPMNTSIREKKPKIAREFKERTGQDPEDLFDPEEQFIMHHLPFENGIVHVENLGGDLDEVANTRCKIGCFPFRFEGGEAAFCRVVAFLED